MLDAMQPYFYRRGYLWFIFGLSALVGIAFFLIPAFIIRPFAHQSGRGLALALALRERAPWGTVCAGIVCLLAATALCGGSRSADVGSRTRRGEWRRKAILGGVILLVAFSTAMARLNYFEWMFHPVDSPQFELAAASKLDKGEMVLAVRMGSDARAYPIREMAYHHIVNDLVGGVAVAVTY
jgi:hypothetical protein